MASPLDKIPNQADADNENPQVDTPETDNDSEQAGDANVSSQDVEIAVRLGIKMLNEGNGLQVIADAVNKSKDPGQVIGQFLAQMMAKMAEQLQQKIGLDPKVFLAKKGFLETILDYIETKLGLPSEFSDQVYGEVLEVIKAAAMQPPAPNNVMRGGQVQAPTPLDQQGGA